MGVGWKVGSWTIIRADRMDGGKGPTYALSRGFGKV
jgi:hypothetical protein